MFDTEKQTLQPDARLQASSNSVPSLLAHTHAGHIETPRLNCPGDWTLLSPALLPGAGRWAHKAAQAPVHRAHSSHAGPWRGRVL